jgi:hypothetical protein
MGFEWKLISYVPSKLSWEENFEALKEYKKNYGDCNVPRHRAENKQLAQWVSTQRLNYRRGNLAEDRIKRLEDIGFLWELLELSWEEMFVELIEYKKNHGDCNVPQHWAENKQLGMWVANQRKNYRIGKLSEDRIKRLEDMGFVWKRISYIPSKLSWEENFEALKEYKKNHRDCNVPPRWAENKQLGRWVGTQRGNYRKGELSNDRIKRLEDIGFVWDVLESSWEEMFEALKEYKKINGNCNAPQSLAENKQLGMWVANQRQYYRKGKLSEARIKRLEDMGFVWKRISYIPSKLSWEENFEALKEYKKNHGDCNVPQHWAENKQLGTWVTNQRQYYRKGKLDKDRIKRLEDIGFEWNIRKR